MSVNRVRTLSIAFGLAACIVVTAPAFAAAKGGPSSNGDAGGGPAVAPANVAAETQQSRDKMALAAAWAAENVGVSGGTGTLTANRSVAPGGSYSDLLATYAAKYGPDSLGGATRSASVVPGASALAVSATSLELPVVWYRQTKSYYCGPATGYMMLKYKGFTTSVKDGTALSQARLATTVYMSTDLNGATSTFTNNMNWGLNRWRNGADTGYYVRNKVDSADELRIQFTYSTTIGEPTAVSAVENAGAAHYNGHPVSRTIGHWVVGVGYQSSGSTIVMLDPASGLVGYESAATRFTYSTSAFYGFTAGRYDVW